MKLLRKSSLFNKFQALLLLGILLANIYVEASVSIKVNKLGHKYTKRSLLNKKNSRTTKKSSKFDRNSIVFNHISNSLPLPEKLKNLFIGFLEAIITHIVESEENSQGYFQSSGMSRDSDSHVYHKVIEIATNKCYVESLNFYEKLKIQKIKETKQCIPEVLNILLRANEVQIHSACEEKKIIDELDTNEFSTFRVIIEKIKNIFVKDEEYEEAYENFKARKTYLNDFIDEYKDYIIPRLRDVKSYMNEHFLYNNPAYDVVVESLDNLTSIFPKSICEVIDQCSSIPPLEHLKVFVLTGLEFLRCSLYSQIDVFIKEKIKKIMIEIFRNLGLTTAETIVAAVFPAVLLALIIKFLANNISVISDIIRSLLGLHSETGYIADQVLYKNIGKLLGKILIDVNGLDKRKLKKFRKIDAHMSR